MTGLVPGTLRSHCASPLRGDVRRAVCGHKNQSAIRGDVREAVAVPLTTPTDLNLHSPDSRTVVNRCAVGSYKPHPLHPTAMHTSEFVDRLDAELRTDDYADVDASPNGLQVGTRDGEIEHVAFAVDAAEATIDAAVGAGADALVTHHGLVWGGLDTVTGREYERIAPLIENDVALYVSHLPLDGHQELGNAAGVADLLSLESREAFGEVGPETVGQFGECREPIPRDELTATLNEELDTDGRVVQTLGFGPEQVEQVAVLTGSGVDWLDEAVAVGADALVTGEGKQQVYHEAKEAGVNVVLAGHYATETFGVQSLQALAEEWGLETTYVDHPTGL